MPNALAQTTSGVPEAGDGARIGGDAEGDVEKWAVARPLVQAVASMVSTTLAVANLKAAQAMTATDFLKLRRLLDIAGSTRPLWHHSRRGASRKRLIEPDERIATETHP